MIWMSYIFNYNQTYLTTTSQRHTTKLTRGVRSTSLGLRHIAQKAAQRRVSKTLCAIYK